MPVTSLGHHRGEEFSDGLKFLKLCAIVNTSNTFLQGGDKFCREGGCSSVVLNRVTFKFDYTSWL